MAINLDAAAVKAIGKIAEAAKAEIPPELLRGMRFVPERNWHLTLSFLGSQDEDGITGTLRALAKAVPEFRVESVIFNKLSYGPPGKQPRMLWLSADAEISRELGMVKKRLEDELEEAGVHFAREQRPLSGHITLARFSFGREEAAQLTPIGRDVDISSAVASLDLMESELRRGGAEYSVLQKFPLS